MLVSVADKVYDRIEQKASCNTDLTFSSKVLLRENRQHYALQPFLNSAYETGSADLKYAKPLPMPSHGFRSVYSYITVFSISSTHSTTYNIGRILFLTGSALIQSFLSSVLTCYHSLQNQSRTNTSYLVDILKNALT